MNRSLSFGSLFAGIGGIDLGLERAGMTCAWQVEVDDYCLKVLNKHWPDVQKYGDIREIESLPHVDLIAGGFPCQRFSTASRGRRTADDLWPAMLRVLLEIRPVWILAENVTRKAIEMAEGNVRANGWKTRIRRVGAHEVGADHQRNRWWLLAHAYDESKLYSFVNAEVAVVPEVRDNIWGRESFANRCRMAHGVPSRVDRLRALGNAVVPQVAEWIGRRIIEFDE